MTDSNETVSFCDPAQASDNPEDVSFCVPEKEPEDPQDVKFCDGTGKNVTATSEEGNCPEGTTAVSISGTATPGTEAIYTATGGLPPYTFRCTGAYLETTGPATAKINTSDSCGTGSISVTDACGQTASIAIRFTSGQWVLVEDNFLTTPSYTSQNYTFYEGAKKIIMTGSDTCWYTWTDGGGGCPTEGNGPVPTTESVYTRHPDFGEYCEGSPTCNGGASYGNGTGVHIFYWQTEKVYEWKCP